MSQERAAKELNLQAAEVLERAADRVQFLGWCQGGLAEDEYGLPTGVAAEEASAWCSVGAIRSEAYYLNQPVRVAAAVALCDAIGISSYGRELANWNDAPGRTRDEVADAMRTAAKKLREDA